MKKSFLTALASFVIVAGAFGAGVAALGRPAPAPAPAQKVSLVPSAIKAQSAILYDLKSGEVLWQKDAQEPLPLASLTKLMTASAVLASRQPSTRVEITPGDLSPEGDWGLRPGDVLSIRDLIKLGLVASSNDAIAAAASSLGTGYIAAMNNLARQFNLTKTSFSNSTGLDLNDQSAGAYGSAFDVARLTGWFYQQYPAFFAYTAQPAVSVNDGGRVLSFDATMAPLQNLPGFIGAKTGYTDLAGGNLAAVIDLSVGHPVVAVVLHSSEAGRFSDIRTLIAAARNQP
jgi:D-alanyl-D-alanine carboxypeptidase